MISTCTCMLCCFRQLILIVFSVLFSEFNPRLHSHILMYRIQLQPITRWVDLLSTEFIVLSWKLLRGNLIIYYFILAYGFTGKIIFQLCPPMVYIPQLFKRNIMHTISGYISIQWIEQLVSLILICQIVNN